MAFVEKNFKPENYEDYKDIVKAIGHLGYVHQWLVDEDRKIHFFDFGGRGEMPASTGAPPNQYALVVNSMVYYFELRRNMIGGKVGGVSCEYNLERMSFPNGNLLKNDEVIALLKDHTGLAYVCRLWL
jgi:hypothetical protein